jgi:gamma-glutamyltranspeptidase/glutathione hydrolase
LSAGIPGTVAGLELARGKYGSQSRAALIAPSIKLAEQGFVLNEGDTDILAEGAANFKKDAPTAKIFLKDGRSFRIGERLVQKDLGHSLRLISRDGPKAFYDGPIADAMVAASQAGKGIFSKADFRQYQARELAPVECDYRGYHVVSAPPPSSGGVVICQLLNILEGYPLKELGYLSAQGVHYQIEAMRHAYIDRNNYLGDPDFVKNPLALLLDKDYAAKIRAAIDPAKAGDSMLLKPGVAPHEGSNTTHYSIVDAAGNAVSVTYTLNNWFGAYVTPPGTGILLNDEMDDFTVKVGVPNLFGLVQGEANAIAPGKRPLSSMSPTIVSRDGKPVMVTGTPGGSRIITVVLHTILNVIDYGMNVQEAVDAPRFHHQWLPDQTFFEANTFSPDTRKILLGMGHKLTPVPQANHVEAILIGTPTLGGKPRGEFRYFGANDPRRNSGSAQGY